MFSTGISGERDEAQDIKISDIERRILELEKEYSKKFRYKIRDWYRNQL